MAIFAGVGHDEETMKGIYNKSKSVITTIEN